MKNRTYQNSSSYNLLPLLTRSFMGYVTNLFRRYEQLNFPPVIGNYVFHSRIKKVGPRKSYLLGIYKNSEGKKALFKMRSAKIKDYHYFSLKNEIVLYETLSKIITRLDKSLPKRFKNIYIPKTISVIENNTYIGILLEYIEGVTAQTLSPHQKIKIYFDIVDFLHYIGENLTNEEKEKISKREPLHYFLLYPLLVIKAIMTYPKSTIYIILGIPKFLTSVFYMLKDGKTTLVHRDLHFKNIMISGSKLVLIDLQQCVLTEPLHEVITTLRYWWKRDSFYLLLLDAIYKRRSLYKNFKPLFRGLIVNSVTHGLTGKSFSKETINAWIDFLKYGISFKNYKV